MESNRPRELGTGLFVFLGFAALLFLATQTTDLDEYAGDEGYRVTARFEDVAGTGAKVVAFFIAKVTQYFQQIPLAGGRPPQVFDFRQTCKMRLENGCILGELCQRIR